MRIIALTLVLFALVDVAHSAALLRFINAVPTQIRGNSRSTAYNPPGYPSSREVTDTSVNTNINRVGLEYFVNSGTVQSSTVVWTEMRAVSDTSISGGTAPYAWIFAMPPLRAYHGQTSGSTETNTIDRVSQYLNTENIDASCDDFYEHTQLKADGVGLYLSFAAGTYSVAAYGVRGGSTYATNSGERYTSSFTTLTFADNNVYTLVAIGNGNFDASSNFGAGGSVKLVLFQESTAPTTFGKASLRFFHAIQNQMTANIDIQDTTLNSNVVKSLAFGTLSSYVDISPATQHDFAVTRSDNSNFRLAPNDAFTFGASFDVRAGLRATVICANSDTSNPKVFCRMIPSRVVAYVRLINDNLGNNNYVQSKFGTQRIQDVTLSLWASYNLPYPTEVTEFSQVLGQPCLNTPSHPLLTAGLYPIVNNIGKNNVSDYGEVFVPQFIMDYAVRSVVRESVCAAVASASNGASGTAYTATTDDPQNPTSTSNSQWFDLAPVFKRVNFAIKTDGFATMALNSADPIFQFPADGTNEVLTNVLLLNEYLEPGQYYSIAVSPVTDSTKYASLQSPNHVSVMLRLDQTINMVSSGVASGRGVVRFIPLGTSSSGQGWTASPVTFTNRNTVLNGFTATFVSAKTTGAGKSTWVNPANSDEVALTPDTYRYTSTSSNTNPCTVNIPSDDNVVVTAGQRLDVFVFGSYQCSTNNNNIQALSVVKKTPARFTFASTTCGTTTTTTTSVFFGSASSVSASLTMMFVAVIAVLAVLF